MTDAWVCPECNGTQWKRVGDKARPCVCLSLEMLDHYLGPDLSGAPKIHTGPLYAFDREMNATLDRTSENLFIKSTWPTILPHLRLAIGHRYWYVDRTFRHFIVTDERILNVYVGNERYGARSKMKRDDMSSFNGLKDLVEEPDLLVVRLGFIGHKNIAAPGALKQALMLREAARRPTWVVQNPAGDYPISWNEEVAAYFAEYFDVVDMRKLPQQPEPTPTIDVEEHSSPAAKPRPQATTELMPTIDSDSLGVTRAGAYKAGRRPTWKKRRDDGDKGGGGDMPPV